MKVKDLFTFETGNLPALELTDDGDVPLVYGTTKDNGIIKFVKVDEGGKIFNPPLITVSYLGTAFVQLIPFTTSVVDKSNIIILRPKIDMSIDAMYFYSAQINRIAEFGFHYGRRMNMKKLSELDLKKHSPKNKSKIEVKDLFPIEKEKVEINHKVNLKSFSIKSLTKSIVSGEYHSQGDLDAGKTPFISCTSDDNGIGNYLTLEETHKNCVTVASDGSPLSSFYHPYKFGAQDNVLVLKFKEYKLTTIFYILTQLNQLKWRFSYGRKCYSKKIDKINIMLPIDDKGNINEGYMEKVVRNSYGWEEIETFAKSFEV